MDCPPSVGEAGDSPKFPPIFDIGPISIRALRSPAEDAVPAPFAKLRALAVPIRPVPSVTTPEPNRRYLR